MSWQQLALQLDQQEQRLFESEDQLQAACVEYWQRFRKVSLLWHVPNGGSRDQRETMKFKATGVKAGIPDLHMIVKGGHFFVFELKNGRKKLDPAQEKIQMQFIQLGLGKNHFHICTLNEFKAALAWCFHLAGVNIEGI